MSPAMASLCVSAALTVGAARTPAPAPATPAPTEIAPAPAPAPTHAPVEAAPIAASDPAQAAPAPTITLQPGPAPVPTEPAPAPTVAVQPAPAPYAPPPPRPAAPSQRSIDALLITGAVAMGVGGLSLLFVAAPAGIVRNVALRRAEREDALAFSTRKTRYERARRADDAMEAGFWVGAPLVVGGAVLLVTGLVLRANARSAARMAAVPGGLVVRF